MLRQLIHVDKLNMIAIISLLICALFLPYYNINYTVKVYEKADESASINRDTYTRYGRNANKIRFAANKLADTNNEEIVSERPFADSHNDSLEKKWSPYYLYLFLITIISSFILYIKGWFIKVTHSRFQFYQVHFTQLKDGKKDALSYNYSM